MLLGNRKREADAVTYSPHAEFSKLYKTYTSDPDSIGAHLTRRMAKLSAADPLLVVTGSDVVLFPGSGLPPSAESFRRSTRGFIELASISHLGTAVAWIFRLRELNDPIWRKDAERLIGQIDRTRQINTEHLWERDIAVPALAGYASKIADLVDYSCDVTKSFLIDSLADESRMNFDHLRDQYLDPVGSTAVPVPINDMMLATFALAFLDIGYRIIGWLRNQALDWQHLMVMISGRSGRPTAGVTWSSNNMCHLLWKASDQRLSKERVYIAPHAPSFVLADIRDEDHLRSLDAEYRDIWLNTRASVELARAMFEGYPAFEATMDHAPVIDRETKTISQLPTLRSPDDRFAAIARLRFVMEDPAQLLANAVASYIVDRLCACGNQPAEVFIPGFTNVAYPARREASRQQ